MNPCSSLLPAFSKAFFYYAAWIIARSFGCKFLNNLFWARLAVACYNFLTAFPPPTSTCNDGF